MALMYPLERRSSSFLERDLGSTMTPPLAPPKGRPTAAVLMVIQKASEVTSSKETCGWNRMPPFVGPRTSL